MATSLKMVLPGNNVMPNAILYCFSSDIQFVTKLMADLILVFVKYK